MSRFTSQANEQIKYAAVVTPRPMEMLHENGSTLHPAPEDEHVWSACRGTVELQSLLGANTFLKVASGADVIGADWKGQDEMLLLRGWTCPSTRPTPASAIYQTNLQSG